MKRNKIHIYKHQISNLERRIILVPMKDYAIRFCKKYFIKNVPKDKQVEAVILTLKRKEFLR